MVYIKKNKDSDDNGTGKSERKRAPIKKGKNPLKVVLSSEKTDKRKVRKDFFSPKSSDSKPRFEKRDGKENTRTHSDRDYKNKEGRGSREKPTDGSRFKKNNDTSSRRSINTENKPFRKTGSDSERRPYRDSERAPYQRDKRDSQRAPSQRDDRDRSQNRRDENNRPDSERRPYRDSERAPYQRDNRDNQRTPYQRDDRDRSQNRRDENSRPDNERRPYRDSERAPYQRDNRDNQRTPYQRDDRDRSQNRRDENNRSDSERRPYRDSERAPYQKDNRDNQRTPYQRDDRDRSQNRRDENNRFDKPRKRNVIAESDILSDIVDLRRSEGRGGERKPKILSLKWSEERGPIRLNKYIANAGICSRRDADKLIEAGAVKVNGVIVTELGTKVMPIDEVRYEDKILQREKPVYILLNKPKDYITTTEDEKDRNHVMMLIEDACAERVYPVGRLDRNTTGLLLFTNDGEMAKKLTHPRYGVRKIYHIELDRNLDLSDFEKIAVGMELRDGLITPDDVAYVGESKKEIGITLHSGKNRIVRRIFEQLEYNVEKLDRVSYAGLTKKDLPRGHWRFLRQEEINILKMSTAVES